MGKTEKLWEKGKRVGKRNIEKEGRRKLYTRTVCSVVHRTVHLVCYDHATVIGTIQLCGFDN